MRGKLALRYAGDEAALILPFLLVLSIFLVGCQESTTPKPLKVGLWTSTGLNSTTICQVFLKGDTLFAVLGQDGIAWQTPPVAGEWKFAANPSPNDSARLTAAYVDKTRLIAGFQSATGGSESSVMAFNLESRLWESAGLPFVRFDVLDIHMADGAVYAVTNQPAILQLLVGAPSWQTVWDEFLVNAKIENLGANVFVGGSNNFRTPTLLKSNPVGGTFKNTHVHNQLGLAVDAPVESVALTNEEIWITIRGGIYSSPNGCDGFQEKLRTLSPRLQVFAEPTNTSFVIGVGDSLYISQDLGKSWESQEGPAGAPIFTVDSKLGKLAHVDWPGNRVFVAKQEAGLYRLFCFDLDLWAKRIGGQE